MNRKGFLLVICGVFMLAMAVILCGKPRTVHAALLPVTMSAAVDGGYVVVSPSSGFITYCPAFANITGLQTTLAATPLGQCTTLTGARPLPTTDKWTLTNVPSSHEFFMLDTANGTIINCAVTIQVDTGPNPPLVFAAGTCQNWGTAPQ